MLLPVKRLYGPQLGPAGVGVITPGNGGIGSRFGCNSLTCLGLAALRLRPTFLPLQPITLALLGFTYQQVVFDLVVHGVRGLLLRHLVEELRDGVEGVGASNFLVRLAILKGTQRL